MIEKGSIIVTNTMIVEASKFIQFGNGRINSFDIGRFFDLCSLIEASILHKQIVTIEGGYNYEEHSNPLTKLLRNEKILIDQTIPYKPLTEESIEEIK